MKKSFISLNHCILNKLYISHTYLAGPTVCSLTCRPGHFYINIHMFEDQIKCINGLLLHIKYWLVYILLLLNRKSKSTWKYHMRSHMKSHMKISDIRSHIWDPIIYKIADDISYVIPVLKRRTKGNIFWVMIVNQEILHVGILYFNGIN